MTVAVTKLDLLDQFLDDNADALALGTVTTSIAASSTPLATYTDSTGGTANANPTTLDSSGRGHFWFAQGSSYKVIVKDAAGVTKYTEDGISISSTSATTTTYVDIPFEVLDGTPPTSSQSLAAYVATEAIDFAIDFAGSQGKVLSSGTNPTGTFTAIVKKNGSQIGTVVISTGGSFTFTTSGGTTQSLAAGDILETYGPSSADATLILFAWTFRGTVA